MADNEIELLSAQATLAVEVEVFLETNLGRYILGCREQDEADAIEQLVEFNPYQFDSLAKLQSALIEIQQNVLIAKKVHGYLSDAIINGNQAEEILENLEEE